MAPLKQINIGLTYDWCCEPAAQNRTSDATPFPDMKLLPYAAWFLFSSGRVITPISERPSDPRILYVGGDKKLRYANMSPERQLMEPGNVMV